MKKKLIYHLCLVLSLLCLAGTFDTEAKVPFNATHRIKKEGQLIAKDANRPKMKKSDIKAGARSKSKSKRVVATQPEGELKTYKRAGRYDYTSGGYLYVGNQPANNTVDIVYADGNKVWLKNILCGVNARLSKDSWVEGTIQGNIISVPLGQSIFYSDSYHADVLLAWGTIAVGDEGTVFVPDDNVTAVQYEINGETITMLGSYGPVDGDGSSLEDYMGHGLSAYWSDDNTWLGFLEWNTVLTEDNSSAPTVITEIPAGCQIYNYGRNSSYIKEEWEEGMKCYFTDGEFTIAFDTNDDVYVKNPLCLYDDVGSWVKGSYDRMTGIISIPTGQYLYWNESYEYGIVLGWGSTHAFIEDGYGYFDYDIDVNTTEIQLMVDGNHVYLLNSEGDITDEYPENFNATGMMSYRSDNLKFTSVEFSNRDEYGEAEPFGYIDGSAVPAVPANPTVDGWYDSGNEEGNSRFSFTLPHKDVDGNHIFSKYLSYSIFVDNGNGAELFTFPASDYSYNLTEDITEVTYEIYSNGYDFCDDRIFFYRTNASGYDPLFTEDIGIQVYYTVDGVKHASDIVWLNNTNVPTAYACYTPSNTTLTFYYDTEMDSRPGTTYLVKGDHPRWQDGTEAYVTKVVFDPSFADARPTSTRFWFNTMRNLQSITGISYLNTSKVTDMYAMFSSCEALTNLDVSGFNTAKVTNMSGMFNSCETLTSLDLRSFNTARVTNMEKMFMNCSALTTIYASNNWTTAAVTSSEDMFYNCSRLEGGQGTRYDAIHEDKTYARIDGGPSNPGYFTDPNAPTAYACYTPSNATLTFYYDDQRASRPGKTYSLNTPMTNPGWYIDETYNSVTKVIFNPSFAEARPTSTHCWFYYMRNLQSIVGLSYLNTSYVTDMSFMFIGCELLTSLNLDNFNTANVTNMGSMFQECSDLTSLKVSNFNTANVFDMFGMFQGCRSLTSLDLSSFNTAHVMDMRVMFNECWDLATIYVGDNWSTENVTSSEDMFRRCNSLVGGMGTAYSDSNPKDKTYAHIDGGSSDPGYFTTPETAPYACYTESNTTLTFYYDNQRGTRPGKTYLLNTGTPGWNSDGSNASVTRVVFNPSFAEARPTSTYCWFDHMVNLTEITGISYLNTSEVTNMRDMFNFCSGLTSLDLSGFNTAKVTIMGTMFNNCRGLTHLDLSSFNTSNVILMSNMLSYCTSLQSVDLSSFNTANVTTMYGMFAGCTNLKALDLSNFNTAKVSNMAYMFDNCRNLVTIMAGNGWTTEAVTSSSDMFALCLKLVGGKGTTYSSANPRDKTYAHLDGGYSNPGYLTDKGTPYVTISQDGKTLTFYCDGKRLLHMDTEQTYLLNDTYNEPEWLDNSSAITTAVFDPSFAAARPISTCAWFADMPLLMTITGMEYLNTSEVVVMNSMFSGSPNLTSIDVSHFDTRKVEEMNRMFGWTNFTVLDLSSFNTANVVDMSEMFRQSSLLRAVAVGDGWSTENVRSDDDMFRDCTSIVGGKGTTYSPGDYGSEFAHVDGGEDDPGYFVDSNFLYGPYAVLWNDGKALIFYHDGQRYLCSGRYKTYSLDWPAGDDPYWYQDEDHYNITDVMFSSSFAAARPTSTSRWFLEMENLENIINMNNLNTSEVTDMSDMFNDCCTLTSLDVSHFDTQNVTDMSGMFNGCSELTSLDVSGFDTHNVTDMSYMFGVGSVTTLDVSGFDTRKVTNMRYMFGGCVNVATLDVSGFDTRNVTDMSYMFYSCEALTNLDVSGFNTAKVTNMSGMFNDCYNLKSLDVTHFNTANVTAMTSMFHACKKLTSLDLSSFNTAKVTMMSYMFRLCTDLKTIYAGDGWTTAAVTNSSNMFQNCTSLVGGKGTTYNANHVDKAYAHIDGGTSNPGYFSEKGSFLRGDVDNDGQVKISDVTALINYLLSGDVSGINLQAADCDQNGEIKIGDVTELINYLLSGRW